MARPQSELTKLIMSLPSDLPVAEVLAKAKEAGMETTDSNVSRVRAEVKKKASKPVAAKKPAAKKPVVAKKPAAKKPAAKKVASKPSAKKTAAPAKPASTLSKADFIRQQPATMGARAVVEAAKAVGLTISENHVYGVRADLKKKPAAPATKAAPQPKAATPKPAPKAATAKPKAAGSNDEVTFRRLVLGLGITRSRQLLDELEQGLARLIGG
jgi:hypothetical protein